MRGWMWIHPPWTDCLILTTQSRQLTGSESAVPERSDAILGPRPITTWCATATHHSGGGDKDDATKQAADSAHSSSGRLSGIWRGLCFDSSMRTGRFLVSDLDEDLTASFRNADYAVRFARWLARGRSEELSVVVSDEARSGAIVWIEPQPKGVAKQAHLTGPTGL